MNLKENALFAGRYQLSKLIGVGGFSEVWLATDQMTEDTRVAIKVFVPDKGLDEDGIHQFRKEYALTQPLNHSNLLKANYFDIFESSPYLVMPFMENGSLSKLMYKKETFSEEEIIEIIKQIGSGMSYLHRNNIVHQDIKPDNILVDREGNYLLTDFGISSKMRNTLTRHSTSKTAMTVSYAPPERFGKYPQTTPAGDIFSFGVMMYELTTGEVPWMGAGGVVLRSDDQVPLIPETFSAGLSSIIEKCMSVDPANRPTANELVDFANAYFYKKIQPPAGISGGKKTVLLDHDAAPHDQPPAKHKQSGQPKGSETVMDNAPKQKGKDKFKATIAGVSSRGHQYQADSQETIPSRKNRKPGLKIIIPAALLLVAAVIFGFWNFSRTKTTYYKNYVEEWGVPRGIHELSAEEVSSREASYKFVSSKGKLREISRVNSSGYISSHSDSEQLERPDIATYVYSRNGDLDYQEIKDKNGTLFLADYDLKEKTVNFVYNDVIRTPYYLTGRTSNFGENPFATKGKVKGSISRFNLSFDDKGRVTQVMFANPDNIGTGDQDAVYGRRYLYDEKGNLLQKTLIGRDGSNENNNSGISIVRYQFDQADNWISSEWLDKNNKLVLTKNDFAREENTFDTYGNIIKTLHFDTKNNLCLRSDAGAAGVVRQFNSKGECIRQEFTDLAGKLTTARYGMASAKFTYDQRGIISGIEYFDINDQPCLSSKGVFKIIYDFDSKGNQTEFWNYNLNNKYCLDSESGIAGQTLTYDARGNVVGARNFGANKELLNDEYRYAGVDMQYDQFNNILERKWILSEKNRAITSANFKDISALIIRYKYDKRNNVIEESHYDQGGAPFMYNNDYHGSSSEYDERGNITRLGYFGLNREPKRDMTQVAYTNRKYDRKSNLIEESYYDENGQPCTSTNGMAGYTATYNDENLQTGWRLFDVNRQLAGLNRPVVEVVYTYDEEGKRIDTYYFNKDRQKVDWNGNRI